jgi:hypothetical protein
LPDEVDEVAAIERVPMRMTVFTAVIDTCPGPAADWPRWAGPAALMTMRRCWLRWSAIM